MAETDVGAARRALGDVTGVGGVDDVGRLTGVGHAQGDPEVGVGADLGRHDTARPLRGQQQVDAEGAAPLGDVDETRHEVGQIAHHGRELVDDDEQSWHGRVRGVPAHQILIVLDVLGVGGGEDVLAPLQLRAQRLQGALDQVRVEVGDHADGVREFDAVLEGGTALVVDEDERHVLGRVGDGQRRHDGLEQFRLTRTGRTGDQSVRAVAPQVDAEGTVVRLTDDRHGRLTAHAPARGDVVPRRGLQLEHVEEPARGRERGVLGLAADVAQRRQRPGQPGAPGGGDEVGPHPGPAPGAGLLDAQPQFQCPLGGLLGLLGALVPGMEGRKTAGGGLRPGVARPRGDGVVAAQRLGDDEGLALAGQEALLLVQADRVHGDRRPFPQQSDDTRQRPQPTRPVPDDDDVRVGEGGTGAAAVVLLEGLLPGVEQLRQLADPGAHGLGVRPDQHVDVLAAHRAGVRQPADPVPARLCVVLGEHVELHVHRAVQHRGLRHGPPGEGLCRVAGTRDTDDAQVLQGQRDGRVLDLPGDLALVIVLLGVVEDDFGRYASGADPQEQVVGVRAPPLPQPGTGAGAEGEHRGGVGDGAAPVEPLQAQRVLGVLLDPLLGLLVLLDLLGMGLAPVLLVHEVVAEEHDRAQQSHDHVVPAPEDHHGHDRADQREQGHQPGQRPGFVLVGRRGQPKVRLALRRPQARRPVVVEPDPVLRPLQCGVGRGVAVDLQQRVPEGQLGPEGPGPAVEVLPVEPGVTTVAPFLLLPLLPPFAPLPPTPLLPLLSLLLLLLLPVPGALLLDAVEGDVAGAVHGDGQRGGACVEFGVVDTEVSGGAAADVVPTDTQPVHDPGGGTPRHPELHDTGRLTGHAAGRIVQADDSALAQRRADDVGVGIEGVPVDERLRCAAGARTSADGDDLRTTGDTDMACQLPSDVADRRLRIGVEHHIGAGSADRVDDGQTQAHVRPPRWAEAAPGTLNTVQRP